MEIVSAGDEHEIAIRRVIEDAFTARAEVDLVAELGRTGALAVSLVAVADGEVVGYAALSRLESPPQSLALAPVAVSRAWHGRGVGSALVHRAVSIASEQGYASIFVLGAIGYYGRFGFSAEAARGYPCRYAGPSLLARHLASDAAPAIAPVIYAAAFDGLG